MKRKETREEEGEGRLLLVDGEVGILSFGNKEGYDRTLRVGEEKINESSKQEKSERKKKRKQRLDTLVIVMLVYPILRYA